MLSFDETHFRTDSTGSDRLETPATVGVRPGMTCSGLIARKLGAIYDVGPNLPSAMEIALEALDRCLEQKRRA